MAQAVQKVGDWHESIIDFMLSNPQCPPHEVAAHFAVSQHWLNIITNSDIFQERLRLRQAANGGESIVQPSEMDQARSAAKVGFDVIASRLERGRNQLGILPNDEVCRLVETALKALGHKAPSGAGVFISDNRQVNTLVVDREVLETARTKMRELKKETTEIELEPLPTARALAPGD